MTKSEYREYIASADWQQRRKQFLVNRRYCEICGVPRWLAQVAYNQDLNVHHFSYANLGKEIDSEVGILCRRCHEKATFGRTSLREVHSHCCDWCADFVFDPYSELCEVCRALFNRGIDAPILTYKTEGERKAIWQWLLYEMRWRVSTDEIVDELINIEDAFTEPDATRLAHLKVWGGG